MVICLERGADLHMVQLMPLPLTLSCFSKIPMVLPFWYRFTRVVPDKGPLNGCVCVHYKHSLLTAGSDADQCQRGGVRGAGLDSRDPGAV